MSIQYGDTNSSIITIENPDKYNDFVANFNKVDNDEAEPFFAEFKDGKLYFEENNATERSPLDEVVKILNSLKNLLTWNQTRILST